MLNWFVAVVEADELIGDIIPGLSEQGLLPNLAI